MNRQWKKKNRASIDADANSPLACKTSYTYRVSDMFPMRISKLRLPFLFLELGTVSIPITSLRIHFRRRNQFNVFASIVPFMFANLNSLSHIYVYC